MVWRGDDFISQLSESREAALRVCRILATRLRLENVGGPEVPSVVSLVARILLGASREGADAVDVPWLAAQTGLWPDQLLGLLESELPDGAVLSDGEERVRVCSPKALRALLPVD